MRRLMALLLLFAWLGPVPAAAAAPARDADVEAAFSLPEGLRQMLAERGAEPGLSDRERVERLLDFMIADDGLALRYLEQPTYGIAESFQTRRVNCLSFTLMFIAIARASGLQANAQASDQVLAMEVLGDTLFRVTHVNAGVVIDGRDFTVDLGWGAALAMQAPRPLSDRQAIALLRNNEAVERLLDGDPAAAGPIVASAIALDPASATIWSNAGVIHWRAGRPAEAERAYLRALRLRQSHLGALANLVLLYRASGDRRKADAYGKRLARAQEHDPFTQFLRARELVAAGDYAPAVARYRRAIRLLPDQPEFHRGLAEAYRMQGKDGPARRARERASRLESRQAARGGVRAEEPGPG